MALNGICPYFTMFPIEFPRSVLHENALAHEWVMDPFCGRGTTNYAARSLGMPSIGIDSSPVAIALTEAKLANTSPLGIIKEAMHILDEIERPHEVPEGEFWEWAFHPDTLRNICRLREGLIQDARSDDRKALRAIIMGALHGPRTKTRPSYFSNQSPRTYAPKPRYAVQFWKKHGFVPEYVDVLDIIELRAIRYYSNELVNTSGMAILGDSRDSNTYGVINTYMTWVVTSPPYYGLRTYIPDQWIRYWFLGGKSQVEYTTEGQMAHSSPNTFVDQLRQVWINIKEVCGPEAHLVIRFGGINDRKAHPLELIMGSLDNSGWMVNKIVQAGSASKGRRQAVHFSHPSASPMEEHDIWAVLP